MKLTAYSRYDWLLQVVVLPLYITVLNWLLIGNDYWHSWTTFGLATGITLVASFLNWYVNNSIALKINQLHPDPKDYVKRAFRRFIACAASSSLHVAVLFFLYRTLALSGFEPEFFRLGLAMLFMVIIVAVVVITYESMDSFGYWQQSRREVDTLSKAQLQAQLDALRQQVNPHFLFNSLNSLTALISEDPQKAEAFSEKLSSVYRYLLRSNDTPLVPLASELAFVDSYYHLLKTRYGDSLMLVRRILPEMEARQIPPLTVQLLIENAVKHNVILPEQPLMIDLHTSEDNYLIVSNNVQRKPSRSLSNGVGLSNILGKYAMLGQSAPVIEDDGCEFRVMLPLV